MRQENIFLRIVFYGPLIFVPLVISSVLYIFINMYNENFENNLKKIESNLYNIEKKSVENRVRDIIHLIVYEKSAIKDNLKASATQKSNKKLIQTIQKIDNVNNKENYIFILNSHGDILLNKSTPATAGHNDKKNTSDVINAILTALNDKDEAHIEYKWLNLKTGNIETKYSYLKRVPKSDWIVGSGFFLSDIKAKFSDETLNINKLFSEKSNSIIYMALLMMLLSLLISYYISKKLQQSFSIYEKNIHAKNRELLELNETLEDRVNQRTSQLEKIKDDFEKLATTDTLTQIHNRYSLMNILTIEIKRAHRYKTPLSLIMYDIDFFKNVNDTYGHDVGDAVLVTLSQIVKKSLRDSDIVGRYGGEEFLIVLPNTDIKDAVVFAQRLRKEVQKYTFETIGSLTISMGLVMLQEKESIGTLFKRADDLLYIAKNSGRNRVNY